MKRARIFICDDELLIRMWLEEHLKESGYDAASFSDRTTLLAAVEHEPVDLILLDLRLPDGSGIEALPRIREIDATIPIIMITAYGEVETAVAAVRAGAHHFLEKPIQLSALLLLIEQALESRKLRGELDQYRQGYSWQFDNVTVIGRSYGMRRIVELVSRLATKAANTNILIRGESGTGKDIVARAIHAQGGRRTRPFISVNCTALPEHLVES
ncbi:MAG TPA: response regulator, partial [Longimicrobiales bacterium]